MENWQEWSDYESTINNIVAGRVADEDVQDDIISELKLRFSEGHLELKADSIKFVVNLLLQRYYHEQKINVPMEYEDGKEREFAAPDTYRPDYCMETHKGPKAARLKSKRPVAVDAFARFCRTLDGKDRLVLDAMLRKCTQTLYSQSAVCTQQAFAYKRKRLIGKLAEFLQVPQARIAHAFSALKLSKDSVYQPVIPF